MAKKLFGKNQIMSDMLSVAVNTLWNFITSKIEDENLKVGANVVGYLYANRLPQNVNADYIRISNLEKVVKKVAEKFDTKNEYSKFIQNDEIIDIEGGSYVEYLHPAKAGIQGAEEIENINYEMPITTGY